MAVMESIKQKIRQLDAGSFQSLCDALLAKEGYPNIVSLGTEAGTRKTTKGTPDTYFCGPDGRYVFVEYTTQQSGLAAKISDDLKICLNLSKTGIPPEKISEIIYCHTSSNIMPKVDSEYRTLCEDQGINLTIIGIDRLANDLYLKHRGIAKDFLGISIDTGQILKKDEFIKQYDAKRLAAPLDTKFLFREREITQIDEAFQTVDVVILTGPAGTGKTRLALHYAQLHAEKHGEQVFCIRDNALPIYEDLKLYIDKPGQYFLIIDDANQLSGLKHALEYVTMKSTGYEVKVLITVRDYAVSKVKTDTGKITSFKELEIKAFTDDEIKKLLTELLNIRYEYLSRIVRIAEGNARIAMLAGKIACDTNRLDSDDVSDLYESYYGTVLQDSGLGLDKDLLITAGVISFLAAIHMDYIDPLLPILAAKGICRDTFIENAYILHEQEIVDIHNDKAVRLSEQCVANFLLKYVFCDKKLLSIADMVRACFNSYKQRTIASINTLLGVFRSRELHQFVEDEIKKVWNELSEEGSPYFFDFVKTFFRVNPIETLLMLQDRIEAETEVKVMPDDIDTDSNKNYQSVNDDIINILGGFYDSAELEAALDLFFQYYLKRSDLFIQFYHASNIYFSIKSESRIHNYHTQVLFFEKIKEYSNEWQEKKISLLFLEVASSFLQLHFCPAESGKRNTIIMYSVPLVPSDGVDKYRRLIWSFLLELCVTEEYRPKIQGIIKSYGRQIDDVSIPVVKNDMLYISQIFDAALPPEQLANCLIAKQIKSILERLAIDRDDFLRTYLDNEKMHIYDLLKGPSYDISERENIVQQQIKNYISKGDLNSFKTIINLCLELDDSDDNNWEVSNSLILAFKAFAESNTYFTEAVRYYLSIGTPLNIYPTSIINALFESMPVEEVFAIINEFDYEQKNLWLYMYFHELPQKFITKEKVNQLYSFLNDPSDKAIKSGSYRDIDFIEKYNSVDENAYLNGCRIILAKLAYSPFIVRLYFSLIFNKHHNSPKQVTEKFKNDLALLEEIYITMMSYDIHMDRNGEFLREIYLKTPTILPKYVRYIVDSKDRYHEDGKYERTQAFFQLANAYEIFDIIIDALIKVPTCPFHDVKHFMKLLLMPKQGDDLLVQRQDRWIKHTICSFSDNTFNMKCLFSAISDFPPVRKAEYVALFLIHNQDYSAFEAIPLFPSSYTWFGSEIPLLSSQIKFLQLILPNFVGLKFIRHKKYVEAKIDSLRRRIEKEEIEEILEG